MGIARWALVGAAGLVVSAGLVVGGGVAYVRVALPDAGPVPEVTLDTSPEAVKRGEYLATSVMGCVSCHSERDHQVFGHPVTPGTEGRGGGNFGGGGLALYASNITPAAIGHWTDGELWHAVTTGVTPDGRALFPVMPWPNYARASRQDLQDVLAYVRSLRPVENTVPDRVLPGPLGLVVNLMPQPAQVREQAPDPSDEVAYGEYLFALAACGDCHTPRDDRGRPIAGLELAGGMVFEMPHHDGYGIVRSANLTPDPATGLGTWTREQFVGRFKGARDDARIGTRIEPGQTWTPMPWTEYGGMSEQELGAIYAWLKTRPPVQHAVVRFEPAEGQAARGWPPVPPREDGAWSRGALGALCDTVTTDDLPPAGLYAEVPDEGLLQAAANRAKWRGFPEFAELAEELARRPPEARREWVAAAAGSLGLGERCAPLRTAAVPAALTEVTETP